LPDTREDIVEEALRIVSEANARSVPLRLIGGVAIRVRAADALPAALVRTYDDIDMVTLKGFRRPVSTLLTDLGYAQDERFNSLSESRLLFYDVPNQRQADLFVGELRMCHRIAITDRIVRETFTTPLAELLLTKLQIVELNKKDLIDIYMLLHAHDISGEDDGVNGAYVAQLCARDWGLWRTTKMNLERASEGLVESGLDESAQREIDARIDRLWQRIEAEPKSLRWKSRARVGDRMRWYEEPEEVERERPTPRA
jgi:hypothetical protein